jgi:hypothetical protein
MTDQSQDLRFDRGETVYVTPRHVHVFDTEHHTFHPVTLNRESESVA